MIINKHRVAYSLALLASWNLRGRGGGSAVSAFSTVSGSFVRPYLAKRTTRTTASPNSACCIRPYSSSASVLEMADTTEVNVGANLEEVRQRVTKACEDAGRDPSSVRLVAVSKTKPLELLKDAYSNGQRIFGENYVQELVEKAKEFGEDDIQWHFIGALQSNKAATLVKSVVPYGKLTVETVSSLKVAKKLDNAMADYEGSLSIFVQVNTSGEESKSGVAPNETPALCKQIMEECDRVKIQGVMTIGAPGDTECLEILAKCRDDVAAELGLSDKDDLELSMGMSGDFEVAIAKGSTNVRVGSTIFGARDYSNKE